MLRVINANLRYAYGLLIVLAFRIYLCPYVVFLALHFIYLPSW